jgi:hypothetical protein
MNKLEYIITLITLPVVFFSQPIDVTEQSIKVAGMTEEVVYYGFSEGDQMIFSFEEIDGKEMKEVEIIEYPSSSKFMEYKTSKIENKTLTIMKTGIYKFRFYNPALMGRICKYKIQRIPGKSETRTFNTSVYWRKSFDTAYTTVDERYLVKSDTAVSDVTDAVAKVHSVGNMNGNKTTLNFVLPQNTIAWSYYIGVDQAGQVAFENATRELSKTAGPILRRIPGYGPLAALALGGASYLAQLQSGEDIDYWIVEGNNGVLFNSGQQFSYLKKGKVINDFSKMNHGYNGEYFVCLSNDNAITGVSVTVKVSAVTVDQKWGTKTVKKMHLTPKEEAYLQN